MRGAQCATQAGLEGLAVCLRQELRARGVDVSVVAAGEFAAGTAWLSDASMLEQVYYNTYATNDGNTQSIAYNVITLQSFRVYLRVCVRQMCADWVVRVCRAGAERPLTYFVRAHVRRQ